MAKVGEVIGGWTFRRSIGVGGQGQVFAASRKEGEPEAAIKVINCKRPKKKSRFMKEISVHADLSAKGASNIITIIEHNLEELADGCVSGYLVMPIAATTLEKVKELLMGRTELCIEIFRGVVTGIGHAHAAGAIHRDIKPSNVLFLNKTLREPLVSDFGVCLLRDTPYDARLTDVGETVGAKFFMAPEQERGGVVDVGPAADIYALGKLLHHMLTGRFLHREKLEEAFRPEEFESDPRLITVLERILRSTIVEDPSSRLQSTEELLRALDKVHGY
jgi:serine/threonine protein kinase